MQRHFTYLLIFIGRRKKLCRPKAFGIFSPIEVSFLVFCCKDFYTLSHSIACVRKTLREIEDECVLHEKTNALLLPDRKTEVSVVYFRYVYNVRYV